MNADHPVGGVERGNPINAGTPLNNGIPEGILPYAAWRDHPQAGNHDPPTGIQMRTKAEPGSEQAGLSARELPLCGDFFRCLAIQGSLNSKIPISLKHPIHDRS